MNREPVLTGPCLPDAYRDPAFEALVEEIELRLDAARDAVRSRTSKTVIERRAKELCRIIRDAKMEFGPVMAFYGADYQDQARHFVDLAHMASDLAERIGIDELTKSLKQHAEQIEVIQIEARAEQD